MQFSVDIALYSVINFTVMKKDEIGKYLERRRKSLKVNQRRLAEMCGVSEHALCNLENGVGNPTFDLLEKVADTLGLEISLAPRQMEVG